MKKRSGPFSHHPREAASHPYRKDCCSFLNRSLFCSAITSCSHRQYLPYLWTSPQKRHEGRVGCLLYCIVSIHLCSASCSAHQSEALPVRQTQREESSLEKTKKHTLL